MRYLLLSALLLLAACANPTEETTQGTTENPGSSITADAALKSVNDYVAAWERELRTRPQATGEHPVAEAALRELEASIKQAASGGDRYVFLEVIEEQLETAGEEGSPMSEALVHLRSILSM